MVLVHAKTIVADDETGEPVTDLYTAWFVPDLLIALTPSQAMHLGSVVELLEQGHITKEQAQIAEAQFFMNGWEWADDYAKRKKKPNVQEAVSLLLTGKLDDED